MNQSNPIWQISEAEEVALAEERQRLELQIRLAPPLTHDGKRRNRRPRGSLPTKAYIVENTVDSNGHWMWSRARTKPGYGRIGIGKIVHDAQRVSLAIWKGPAPEKHDGCHKCDVPGCLNPAHLFWGTRSDNVNDCVRKGRFNRPSGDRHWTHRRRGDDRDHPIAVGKVPF